MKRAPHITNNTFNRRPYHLRTQHCALIQLSTMQKWREPVKCRAYRLNTGNADPMLYPNEPVQPTCRIKSAASPTRKSP